MLHVATAVMGMENSINKTKEYVKMRHVFGQPLINNQVIHFRLAEMQTEVELLRSLIYRAAGLAIIRLYTFFVKHILTWASGIYNSIKI